MLPFDSKYVAPTLARRREGGIPHPTHWPPGNVFLVFNDAATTAMTKAPRKRRNSTTKQGLWTKNQANSVYGDLQVRALRSHGKGYSAHAKVFSLTGTPVSLVAVFPPKTKMPVRCPSLVHSY